MIQRIENYLVIEVEERSPQGATPIDLTECKNILLAVKQPHGTYLEFPCSLVEGKVVCRIPYEDSMKLSSAIAEVQLMWTTPEGTRKASFPERVPVQKLLREAGYD